MQTDACLSGAGGICQGEYFHVKFPEMVLIKADGNIAVLEMYAILIAVRLWQDRMTGKKIWIKCDNLACVWTINKGKTKHKVMQELMREIAYVSAVKQFWVRAEFIPTLKNEIPDALSRWYQSSEHRRRFKRLTSKSKINRRYINPVMFNMTYFW